MNSKIENYVEGLFFDIPRSKKAIELKEELLSNMSERFEDYIQNGKTENQDYSLVISNLGDIDEMLADVIPNEHFMKEANFYRMRSARNITIGLVLYIVGVICLIGLGGFGEYYAKNDIYGIIGLLMFLVIAAIASGIIVYTNKSTPLEYKDYNNKTRRRL